LKRPDGVWGTVQDPWAGVAGIRAGLLVGEKGGIYIDDLARKRVGMGLRGYTSCTA